MARRTTVKMKILKIGSQEWTGRTVEEAEKTMNADLDRIFSEDDDHPIVIPYRDGRGTEHIAMAYRTRMGYWADATAYQPKWDGRRANPCFGYGDVQNRAEMETIMRRNIASLCWTLNEPDAGERYLDPRDREGLSNHRGYVRWQIKYQECFEQGLPDDECRRQADIARYS